MRKGVFSNGITAALKAVDSEHSAMKYTVILEREPDGGFVASVPVLPGCVSQGDTREEAMVNIKEAVDLYIEDCRVAGDPVPVEDSREYVELQAGVR
jgi:predicted RNase H-like HicB family nuclease